MNTEQKLDAVKTIKSKMSNISFKGAHELEVRQYAKEQAFFLGATYVESIEISNEIMVGDV